MNAPARILGETTTLGSNTLTFAPGGLENNAMFYAEAIALRASAVAWTRVLSMIEGFKQLKPDWDGEGGVAPRLSIIDSVLRLLKEFRSTGKPAPSRAAVTPDGAIFVEWQEPDYYMDLESDTPGVGRILLALFEAAPEVINITWEKPEILLDQSTITGWIPTGAPLDQNRVLAA